MALRMGGSGNPFKQMAKKKAATAAKTKADTATRKAQTAEIAQADQGTVSGRVQKALGPAIDNPLSADITAGAKFGEAVLGPEGLGRLGQSDTMDAMGAQAAELAKGMGSEEMLARKERGMQEITGSTAGQSRAAQAALARSGVKGQAAGAQLGAIAQSGVEARGNLERDLMMANREAQMSGLGMQSSVFGQAQGREQFDISQAAKEKDIALQAGLGFGQMGSAERGAKAANEAQVRAARAGKQSCFIEGSEVEMKDGSLKKIEDIKITDKVKFGSIVYSLHVALNSDVFEYKGVKVAGSHAVLEDGKWLRVEDSVNAERCPGIYTVYNLGNENHRIVVNGITFADFDETDYCSTIDDKESLEVLNGNGSKVLERGRGV